MRCCKTCRWLKVEPDAAGRRVVRASRAYRCEWPAPPLPALPQSLTRRFVGDDGDPWGIERRSYMEPADGRNCPVWEPSPTPPR